MLKVTGGSWIGHLGRIRRRTGLPMMLNSWLLRLVTSFGLARIVLVM